MTWCGTLRGCLAVKFDCNNLLSSVHTLLVNILWCVRLYIKRKYYVIISYTKRLLIIDPRVGWARWAPMSLPELVGSTEWAYSFSACFGVSIEFAVKLSNGPTSSFYKIIFLVIFSSRLANLRCLDSLYYLVDNLIAFHLLFSRVGLTVILMIGCGLSTLFSIKRIIIYKQINKGVHSLWVNDAYCIFPQKLEIPPYFVQFTLLAYFTLLA